MRAGARVYSFISASVFQKNPLINVRVWRRLLSEEVFAETDESPNVAVPFFGVDADRQPTYAPA